jgi:subtilisin family serine protease
VKKTPAGRPPLENKPRAGHAAPSGAGGGKPPLARVAQWDEWKFVPLRVSKGTPAYPVQFTFEDPDLSPEQNARYSELITVAAHDHFKIVEPPPEGEGPAAYLVGVGRRLRLVHDELIVQFKPRVTAEERRAILEKAGFREGDGGRLAADRWIVRHTKPGVAGQALLAAADAFRNVDDVKFAWPNSVAEYVRAAGVATKLRRWWLDKIGVNHGTGSRRVIKGDPSVVIAVLDDGVDIDHPNLADRVAADPGRDYAFADTEQQHFNPRPKVKDPLDSKSDYHGTCCAGLVCSDGNEKNFMGVAPGCKLIGVRVLNGGALISEPRLADAIRYATDAAAVISCSWNGEEHSDVVEALDATANGRNNKGTPVFCAAGNWKGFVQFPASHPLAFAIGACDQDDFKPPYSPPGVELVTPSSDDTDSYVYTTDVSEPADWGFNPGETGDTDGLFYKEFGKTSAATATAAGVGALCLSANPDLTVDDLRDILHKTADKIGEDDGIVYTNGRSQQFGYGCINAADAVDAAKDHPATPAVTG